MALCENCGKSFPTEDGAATRLCPDCLEATALPTTSFAPVGGPAVEVKRGVVDAAHALCLCVVKGPQIGECFYLEGASASIGRDPKAQLFLNDRTVSREHAVIERRDGEVWLRDAGSLNGTYVNGVIEDEAQLFDGDMLQIGTFQMVFHLGEKCEPVTAATDKAVGKPGEGGQG
ncbi:MAG: FHA domain-containing protein [Actinomycetes bacterium]|jgi:pSer/pThr/pTyr-binding forkhead associated (FHA) protein|nr:FHA domain-containing protein [Actinomycetes bacterium]